TLPIARAQDFTTYKDGQTAMTIHVLQGERELVKDCRSLAKFTLRGIPPMVASQARVRITYQIDADGLLSVSARELTTGISSSIEVKPSFGLEDSEISRMLQESVNNAKDDVKVRLYQEALVDANALLESVEKALLEDYDLLSEEEAQTINNACMRLKVAINKPVTNYDEAKANIAKLSSELNSTSDDFANKRMDNAIRKALAGKSVDEISE
ncbi:MAG: Fe-S protein assembly chaperone HscA, partial [Neisseriaceae bacterium]